MKELENDADNIRNGKNSKSSKRGVKMGKGKKMNIMDIAPELRNGRTYISLNFIVEILETSLNYSNVDNCIFFHIL